MTDEYPGSPRWSTTTKLVVALTFAAVIIVLVFKYQNFVGPLIGSFVLAFLAHPIAARLNNNLRLPWRLAVTLVYLVMILFLLGLLAWGGLTIIDQAQSLIYFLQVAINDIPVTLQNLASHPVAIGPFSLDLNRLDLVQLSNEILGVVRPLLTQVGNIVGTFASSAVTMLGWLFFMILISYFILSETGGSSRRLIYVHIPGYEDDLERMGQELGRTWRSFLRGQLIIIVMTVTLYTAMLGLLGVRYYFGLALVAGMARFIPYVGPFIAWTTYGLVSYFQGVSLFGMPQMSYAIMIVAIAWVTDNIIDSLVSPRIMADALAIHPAAVMVGALIGVNLLGFVGVFLAAPVLASIKLIMAYIIRKLSDRDPWADMEKVTRPPQPFPLVHYLRVSGKWIRNFITGVPAWTRLKLAAFRSRSRIG